VIIPIQRREPVLLIGVDGTNVSVKQRAHPHQPEAARPARRREREDVSTP